ncbi:MAG: class I SAM-dependent methyltransferase [Chloroflexi bacterium]|nr:class I SAM-dependent methyltransferase [Chloroflexota bacterium]
MTLVADVLRPPAAAALDAWAERVRANRAQVERFREASPADFYAPVAGMFRADPRRTDEPALDMLRALVRPTDTVLDIGAGGGRYALALALDAREIIAIDPSKGMLNVLRAGLAEHAIGNVRVIKGRWPQVASDAAMQGDLALIAHIGYDVEDIGPFLDAMETAARRLCVAVLLEQPPPTEADRLWPDVHGVERAALPSLPEFLAVLLARGRLFEVRLVERSPQTYTEPDQLLAFLRQQLWTKAGSPKDIVAQRVVHERSQEREGRFALSWESVRIGIVTWRP